MTTSAAQIVRALGGRWNGRNAMCKCPAHKERTGSLSVTMAHDGRVLVHCHAGCSQVAVIDALRARGLWAGEAVADPNYPGRLTSAQDGLHEQSERERRQFALDLWDKRQAAPATLVETYLRARGIRLPISDELGFLPALEHREARRAFPVMLARIADRRGFCAVQRTWLRPDGSGKADVKPAKMTLGPMGGGAVRLMRCRDVLGIAEGIETALSAAQLYSLPVWAVLSANRLEKIDIPEGVETIHIFADAGEVGRDRAFAAAEQYEGHGYHVEVILPDAHFRGRGAGDFNDLIRGAA